MAVQTVSSLFNNLTPHAEVMVWTLSIRVKWQPNTCLPL